MSSRRATPPFSRQRRLLPRRAEDSWRRISFRRRYHDPDAVVAEWLGGHHRAAGAGAGRDHFQGCALQHPQGGVGREQVICSSAAPRSRSTIPAFVSRRAIRSTASRSLRFSASPEPIPRRHISPVKFGYTEVAEYPEFDPAKAQKLLAEAASRRARPSRTHLLHVCRVLSEDQGICRADHRHASGAGFKVNLQTLEVAALGNLLYDKPAAAKAT